MARKNVRVGIPIGNVARSVVLATKIETKHTGLGVASLHSSSFVTRMELKDRL